MKIRAEGQGTEIVFRLNDSQAAQDLYGQMPLTVNVENFGGNEKIFYPRKELRVSRAKKADAKAGTLAYYAPWGDVVMFYKNFGTAAGLYELVYCIIDICQNHAGYLFICKANFRRRSGGYV